MRGTPGKISGSERGSWILSRFPWGWWSPRREPEASATAPRVITNEDKKVKTGYDYPVCNPLFALMDPTYTYSVPRQQMVSGGILTAFPISWRRISASRMNRMFPMKSRRR